MFFTFGPTNRKVGPENPYPYVKLKAKGRPEPSMARSVRALNFCQTWKEEVEGPTLTVPVWADLPRLFVSYGGSSSGTDVAVVP